MKAKIKNKKEIAKGTLFVEFDLLGEKVKFKSGQYFFITLLNPPFKGDGPRDTTHHFSIVNSPNQNGTIEMTTRIRQESNFKKSLAKLPLGSEVEIDRINGTFTLPDEVNQPIVYIALGIGITPFISMIRYTNEEKKDYQITLIYSDSNTESMAFLDELKKLEKNNPKFKLILTITKDKNWQGEKRHVDQNFIKDYFDKPNENIYFISGPPKAVEAVAISLEQANISKENIKTENFSGYD